MAMRRRMRGVGWRVGAKFAGRDACVIALLTITLRYTLVIVYNRLYVWPHIEMEASW